MGARSGGPTPDAACARLRMTFWQSNADRWTKVPARHAGTNRPRRRLHDGCLAQPRQSSQGQDRTMTTTIYLIGLAAAVLAIISYVGVT